MIKWNRLLVVLLVLGWLCLAGLFARHQYQTNVQSLVREKTEEGNREAAAMASHIERRIEDFYGMPRIIAQEPLIVAALNSQSSNSAVTATSGLDDLLFRLKRDLRPDAVWVMNAQGICLGASNDDQTNSFVGFSFADWAYFRESRQDQPKQQYEYGRHTHVSGLFFAAPVISQGRFVGAVAAKMNIDDLAVWLDTTNSFLVDDYGVVVLAKEPGLLMETMPAATVGRLGLSRLEDRYHRTRFSAVEVKPWRATSTAGFVLFNHETTPQMLFSVPVVHEGLRVYVPERFPALLTLGRDYVWYFGLMGTAGCSLILLAGASLQYNQRQRAVHRRLLNQQSQTSEAQRIARFGSWSCDLTAAVLELSEQAVEICKWSPTQPPPTPRLFSDIAAPAERERINQAFAAMIKNGGTCELEYCLDSPPGVEQIVHVQGRSVQNKNGRPIRLVGTIQDITARKRVERESTHMVSLLKATLESTADGILVVDRGGRITSYNDRFLQLWQVPEEVVAIGEDEILLKFVCDQLKCPEAFQTKVEQLYHNPLAQSFDLLEFHDGRIYERYSKPQLIDGHPVGRVWSFYDVTEQKRAEASVLETDRRLRILIDATMDIIFLKDEAGRWQMINQAACKAFSLTGMAYQGLTETELAGLIPQFKKELAFCLQSDQLAWQKRAPFRSEEYLPTPDGRLHCYDMIKVPIFNDDGSRQGLVVVGRDITDRKRTEDELFKSRETLKMVLNNIPQGVFWKNRDLIFEGCNVAMARDCGLADPSQIIGKDDFQICPAEAAEAFRQADREIMARDRPRLNIESTITRPDGSVAWQLVNKLPLHDQDGRVIGILGAYEDITERKMLESQFRQAQKMEAIGRLAGGVAHDFNNLLTVICGYCEILLEESAPDDPSRDALSEIKKAGGRAASLTRQLLAFSRKQILEPGVLDLNAVIGNYENMFRRLLGEDIELVFCLAPELGKIKADASQIDQVVLNLAVNARDAMAKGGKLTIETANAALSKIVPHLPEEVTPGKYVSLTVRDTGCGMDEQTMAHIFEPFFTTKDLGKGTGLGLAMIFGFIKQSGGHVAVTSEIGVGTVFTIYLPEFSGEPREAAPH